MKSQIFTLAATGLVLLTGRAVAQTTLKDAYKGQFLIGAAVNPSWFEDKNAVQPGIVMAQFNSISPENALKWGPTEPRPGQFQFEKADRYVDFGSRNGMFVVGHTLVWHQQTPGWVFKNANGNPTDRDTLLARMRDHIHAVVGRYKGRIKSWDVVNEVLAEDGSLRDSPWRKIIGDDYIEKAFEFAHEADPGAELFYNDYNIESGAKRAGAISLVKRLLAEGIPINGVGIQSHIGLEWPPTRDMDEAITAFGNLGVKVSISELDVNVLPTRSGKIDADVARNEAADPVLNPYTSGLPDKVRQQLTRRYAEVFGVYLKHRGVIERVTLWGVTDGDSWLNNWPIKGRTNYPLLFDRSGQPKPAFDAVINEPKTASPPGTP